MESHDCPILFFSNLLIFPGFIPVRKEQYKTVLAFHTLQWYMCCLRVYYQDFFISFRASGRLSPRV